MMRSFLRIILVMAVAGGILVVIGIVLLGETSGPHPPEQQVKADFQHLGSALRTYKINAGSYPSTGQGLKALVERPTVMPHPDDWVQLHTEIPMDPWKREYQYRRVGEGPEAQFELRSPGRDGIDGTKDDLSSLVR